MTMITHNSDFLCQKARPFYHVLVFGATTEVVPEDVRGHMTYCRHCRSEMDRLEKELQTVSHADHEQDQSCSAITKCLELHFAHIDRQVGCAVVKPFLPSLVVPALEVQTPTPITTHIDHCPACKDDLETIRGLELDPRQLRRLALLLATTTGEDDLACLTVQKYILAVATMDFAEANGQVLLRRSNKTNQEYSFGGNSGPQPGDLVECIKHICVCPDCRQLLYEARLAMRNGSAKERKSGKYPCEKIRSADIFDYVAPFGIDPTKDEYANFRQPFIAHLRDCPVCLEKMLKLHKVIFHIVEREASGISTCFEIESPVEDPLLLGTDDQAGDSPVKVQVFHDSETAEQAEIADEPEFAETLSVGAMGLMAQSPPQPPAANGSEYSALGRKRKLPLRRLAAAAVFVIAAIGIFSFINSPAAAATFDQVIEALKKMTCFSYTRTEKDGTITQYWRSFSPKSFIVKKPNGQIIHSFGEPEQTWRYDPKTNTITISYPTHKDSYLRA